MAASAIVLGASGVALSFFPDEILHLFSSPSLGGTVTLQLLGAAYFGFAMLNWMAKGNLIGGIYSKPVAMANVAHFFIGGITLVKLAIGISGSPVLWAAAAIYSIFAILFYKVSTTHPAAPDTKSAGQVLESKN